MRRVIFDQSSSDGYESRDPTRHLRTYVGSEEIEEIQAFAAAVDYLAGRPRLAAIAALMDFMLTAAFGPSPFHIQHYGSRRRRLESLLAHNPAIYRLCPSPEPIQVVVREKGREVQWDLGRVGGFTAILPLTPEGSKVYESGSTSPREFSPTDHLSSAGECHSDRCLLISGVMHLPSIPLLFDEPSRRQRLPGATRVLYLLLDHFARMLPVLEGDTGADDVVVYSPITGLGMGEALLKTAGFRSEGLDSLGNRKYVFRQSVLAHARVPADEAEAALHRRMRRTFSTLAMIQHRAFSSAPLGWAATPADLDGDA